MSHCHMYRITNNGRISRAHISFILTNDSDTIKSHMATKHRSFVPPIHSQIGLLVIRCNHFSTLLSVLHLMKNFDFN